MSEKLIECKSCGETIAKSAKVCPHCGARQKKSKWWIFVIVAILLIAAIANSGGSDTPKKVSNSNTSESATSSAKSESTKPTQTEFGVGDKVELNNIVVTLKNATISDGKDFYTPEAGNEFVICEFEIENNSTSDIGISSIMSFDAYVDDYSTNMSLTAQLCSDKSQLDGTVAAGKKMNGVIGYEVAKGWKTLEIKFTPNFWSSKDITFIVTNS